MLRKLVGLGGWVAGWLAGQRWIAIVAWSAVRLGWLGGLQGSAGLPLSARSAVRLGGWVACRVALDCHYRMVSRAAWLAGWLAGQHWIAIVGKVSRAAGWLVEASRATLDFHCRKVSRAAGWLVEACRAVLDFYDRMVSRAAGWLGGWAADKFPPFTIN